MSTGKGTLLGMLAAGGLTLCAGVGLPIVFLPTQNLAPIVGFILAPPAGIIGAALGWTIARWARSYLSAAMMGVAAGLLGSLLIFWIFSDPQSPSNHVDTAVMVILGVVIYVITGLIVRKACSFKVSQDDNP